jgi:hypothetical protein
MLSNCPRCGSSLTVKEAIKEYCSHCSGPMDRPTVLPLSQRGRISNVRLRKDFDRFISEELRKSNVLPAA